MEKQYKIRLIKLLGVFLAVIFSLSYFDLNFSPKNFTNRDCVKAESSILSDDEIWKLSSYDSRDYGFVTKVKDQGSSSLCWAYSAISASETSILKSGIDNNVSSETLSLSPTSIGYGRYNRPADPLNNVQGEASDKNWLDYSGNSQYAGILMSQWWGPIANSLPASTNAYENNSYRLKNMITIYDDNTFYNFDTRILEMKKAIAKYGAITFGYNNLRETEFYNPKRETGNYYFHACTIIGWDDNIDASKFVPSGTVKNGGWLVKNSYNSLPYFWLSYECVSSNIYAFDFASNDDYDYNYFYDDSLSGGFTEDLKTQYVANIYEGKKSTSTKDEYLKAVNIAFACKNTTATVSIYTNLTDSSNPESGELKATKSQTFEHAGYRTIELDDLVKIKTGEKFSIVVKLSSTSSSSPYVSTAVGQGLCYRKINGNWSKISYNTLRIKGYSVLGEKEIDTPPIVDIKNANISQIPSFTYTGNEIKPNITITYNEQTLVENVDYTLSYSSNINASNTAKITIVGIGNFNGTQEIFFTINKAEKPNIPIPKTIDNPQNHKTLRLIDLSSDFIWQNPDFELENGTNDVSIIYNNSDKDNYQNIIFTVQVIYTEITEPDTPEGNPDDGSKDESPNEKPSDKDNTGDTDIDNGDSGDNNTDNDGGKDNNNSNNENANGSDNDSENPNINIDGNNNSPNTTDDSLTNVELTLIVIGSSGFCGFSIAGIWFLLRKIKRLR